MSIPLKRTIFQGPLGILPPFFYLSSPLLQKGTVLQGYLLQVCTKEMRLVLLIYFLHNWAAIDFVSHSPRLYFLPLFNNGKCGGGERGGEERQRHTKICSLQLHFTRSAVGRWDLKLFSVMYRLPSSLASLYWWSSTIVPTSHFGMYVFIRALRLELGKSWEWRPTIHQEKLLSSGGKVTSWIFHLEPIQPAGKFMSY